MGEYAYYKTLYIDRHRALPGVKRFSSYFQFGLGITPVDRTGTIKFPIRTKSLFPLPVMRVFTKSYEEVCNRRAQSLLGRANRLDVPLYAFWSGGVDSTCVLISLLKNATAADRDRIVVLLSEESIAEYESFYLQHIRGKLHCEPATLFPYLLGTNNLIVTGEHNDQLFGSDVVKDVANRLGFETIIAPYDRGVFVSFLEERLQGDSDTALMYVRLFERLKEAAPVPIRTNFDQFWWINFAVKWQDVCLRMLSFTAERNVSKFSAEYVRDYYAPFYNTDEFQLWSMNNLDRRIKDGWRSYKWPAKEVIYGFTRDADYRDNKTKRGSLAFLILQQLQFNFIDDKFKFYDSVSPAEFYIEDNDFK